MGLLNRRLRKKLGRASSSVPSQVPKTLSAPECHFPVVHVLLNDKKDDDPKAAYMFLSSSDLRLQPYCPTEAPPSSLDAFRHPRHLIKLPRMQDALRGMDVTKLPLPKIVASRVELREHRHGRAIFVSEGNKKILIFVKDEKERYELFSALKLRIAPLGAVLHRLKEEMGSFKASSMEGFSVAEAALEMVWLDAELGHGSNTEKGYWISFAKKLWKKLGRSAHCMNWASNCGLAIAGSAVEVEKLAKLFCQIGVVGCAVSLISLVATTVHLLGTERDGTEKLGEARNTLHDASKALFAWLVQILGTGSPDDELEQRVFDVMVKCWDAAAKVEKYMLLGQVRRILRAGDIKEVQDDIADVQKQLYEVGILKKLSIKLHDMEKRVADLEMDAKETFQPFSPDPEQLRQGLLSEVAETSIDRIKKRFMPLKHFPSNVLDVANEESNFSRVVLL